MLLQLAVMLVVIVIAAEVFTNALEHLGERLRISQGVTGSLFAAVGTALPESLIPILAIFAGTEDVATNEEISVGAILGAPLMLSTVALFLMALAASGKRGLKGVLRPEPRGLRRDLDLFLLAFGIAAAALFIPLRSGYLRAVHIAISAGLLLIYFVYVLTTVRASASLVAEGHGTRASRRMFANVLGLPDVPATVILQIAAGLLLLVYGAHGFILVIEQVSAAWGVSALLLSLLIVPLATELPEKINSITWIRRGEDTLAFGNITGAMMFQGSVLPAIGILLTPWALRPEVLAGVLVTIGGALWLRIALYRGWMQVWVFGLNGLLYAGYLALMLL
ncbi:MAG: sodium:calcium antiporter [Woeseiaceae bacterium]